MADRIGWHPDINFHFTWSSGHNRHIIGDTAVRSINLNGHAPYGWNYLLDDNTLYMGIGGFFVRGSTSISFDGGYLTSLVGVINITLDELAAVRLGALIRDNGNIKTGLNIGGGEVVIRGLQSNTFTGTVRVQGRSVLYLEKLLGAVAISGDIYVKDGSNVVSRRSGQIKKEVSVSLESLKGEASQLTLEDRVQESFNKLTIEGAGIVDFRGSSKLIIADLDISSSSTLTVVGWEHKKDLFLVRKRSTHVKASLDNIIFQGQSGRVHLEDYNKDYWELTTAPEPATTGVLLGVIGFGVWMWKRSRRGSTERPPK